MSYKNYDIVRIRKPFFLNVNGKKMFFDANIEGVIVESFSNKEYLVEFLDNNQETQYALINFSELVKLWDAPQ